MLDQVLDQNQPFCFSPTRLSSFSSATSNFFAPFCAHVVVVVVGAQTDCLTTTSKFDAL